jgi:hypothetical protein
MRIQANALHNAGAYEQAIELINRLLERYPDHLTA